MAPRKTETSLAPSCAGDATPKSFNYTASGERVEPRGGVYWIPASEFTCTVEAARRDPTILNRATFVPFPRRSTR